MSYEALGIRPRQPLSTEEQRLWRGISVYSNRERARWRAASLTPPRGFLAVLELEGDEAITWEQTGRDPHHVTVWGDPEALLGCVRRVVFVAGADE